MMEKPLPNVDRRPLGLPVYPARCGSCGRTLLGDDDDCDCDDPRDRADPDGRD